MVHSRSESNLNRIFVDLCTTPENRRKHDQKLGSPRQYHPPLPALQSIKSNSCSNLTAIPPISTTTNLVTLQPPSPSVPSSTAIPLMPIESTGFVVQAPAIAPQRSLKLFDTWTINHQTKPTVIEENSTIEEVKNNAAVPLTPTPSNTSQDWKQQDFTNRLRNRLKSRGHLRKYFLS